MTNPDLVEQLAEKHHFFHHRVGDKVVLEGPIDAAIREAISVTRRETLEQAAKLSDGMANSCDEHGTEHFCEYFGCGSFDKLAAEIRRIGENK